VGEQSQQRQGGVLQAWIEVGRGCGDLCRERVDVICAGHGEILAGRTPPDLGVFCRLASGEECRSLSPI
jgi:hypothetical protein